MGIVFAIASLCFAGFNDFLFKQYVRRPQQPMGIFIAGIGLVWTVFFGIWLCLSNQPLALHHLEIPVAAGIASVAANLLFLDSLRTLSGGTGATIYRLNLVAVAILGFIWLGESITFSKTFAIILGGAAVLLLGSESNLERKNVSWGSLLLLLVACLLRAVMGILYKQSTSSGVGNMEMLTINGFFWILGGMIYAWLRKEAPLPSARGLTFSIVSGLLVCGIVYFMLEATRLADASTVVPITQLSFILTCVLGVVTGQEKLSRYKTAALALALGCVLILCRN